MSRPKILLFDIETSPILGYVWSLWDQNVALNQIHTDWHLLSWAAKWHFSKEVIHRDQRAMKNIEDDKALVKGLWRLLDEADVVVTQNGKKFDAKKINARFAIHGLKPPAPYKHIDTLQIAKRHFGFTSNKLEYMTDKLCTKYKKLVDHKFQGFELWKQCLAGNVKAWDEMKRYNIRDVLSLEELYTKLAPWDTTVNLALYYDDAKCSCGSSQLQSRGFTFTKVGKFRRFQCQGCGAWLRGGENHTKKGLVRGV